jgi:hypothetical protein
LSREKCRRLLIEGDEGFPTKPIALVATAPSFLDTNFGLNRVKRKGLGMQPEGVAPEIFIRAPVASASVPLAVATDCDQYLHERLTLLETQLATANGMALANELPDAIITESGLKITPLDAAVPDTAQALIDQTAMILPHVKADAGVPETACCG